MRHCSFRPSLSIRRAYAGLSTLHRRLVRGASALAFIWAMGFGLSLILSITLARLVSTAEFGTYSYILSWIGMLGTVRYFPAVPAIFICHNHTSGLDQTPFHPRIRRYLGVSRVCVERLINEGVPPDKARLSLNFVDLNRFLPRPPLPAPPRQALVFSNYASPETHLPAVTEACRQARLELNVVGVAVGNLAARPEVILGKYDIIFAKAKAAMEAMAVGTAVVLCDFSGVGPMVTAAEFENLRPLNFGFQALQAPLRPDCLLKQISRYDPQDAWRVRDLLRASAGLDQAVKHLIEQYQEVIEEYRLQLPNSAENRIWQPLPRQRLFLKLKKGWGQLQPAQKAFLRRLPGSITIEEKLKQLLQR